MMKSFFSLFLLFASLTLSAQEAVQVPAIEASFPGGSEAMNTYFQSNLKYPVKKTKAEGKVYVEFQVEKDGSVSNTKILKGVDPELDATAEQFIAKMPNWVPAKDEKGNAMVSKMVLPINFKK